MYVTYRWHNAYRRRHLAAGDIKEHRLRNGSVRFEVIGRAWTKCMPGIYLRAVERDDLSAEVCTKCRDAP